MIRSLRLLLLVVLIWATYEVSHARGDLGEARDVSGTIEEIDLTLLTLKRPTRTGSGSPGSASTTANSTASPKATSPGATDSTDSSDSPDSTDSPNSTGSAESENASGDESAAVELSQEEVWLEELLKRPLFGLPPKPPEPASETDSPALKPLKLQGIGGDYAFIELPDHGVQIFKAGQEKHDVKLLRIGVNRVLVQRGEKSEELMIHSGLGGDSLLEKEADGATEK